MKNNNETGRSMLETLSVIVIIMVLVIASMAGYDYLVQRHNRQETVKWVDSLVVNVNSSDMARQVKTKNKVIDAQEIIKGPKVDDEVLLLPDSENSYAVVRSMSNGGFAVALQVDPGTCEALLESLSAQAITAFSSDYSYGKTGGKTGDDRYTSPSAFKAATGGALNKLGDECNEKGCNGIDLSFRESMKKTTKYKNVTDNDVEEYKTTEARLKAIEAECKESGRLMIVSGCSSGSSADHHSSDFICDDCEYGMVRGRENDQCCRTADLCDGYCVCPGQTNQEAGKVRDANGVCHCQVCNSSQQDPTKSNYRDVETCKKFKLFRKHVCYGEGGAADCVECGQDIDCQLDAYPPSKYSGDAAAYAVFGGRELYCVTGNVCRECTASYNSTLVYADDNTVLSDTVGGAGNAYCPKNRPSCNLELGVCQECSDGKVWDPVARDCLCPEGTTTYGKICISCVDDAAQKALDTGCPTSAPICYPNVVRSIENDSRFYDVASKEVAENMTVEEACVECILDGDCHKGEYCASNTSLKAFEKACTGAGCTARKDLRYATLDYRCKVEEERCHDDKTKGDTDSGCGTEDSKDNNLCVPRSNKNANSGNGSVGDSCAYCFDSKTTDAIDDGCEKDSTKPLCKRADGLGKYGTSCHVCQKTKGSAAGLDNADLGCGSGIWTGRPVCKTDVNVAGNQSEDDTAHLNVTGEMNAFGDACYACRNDHSGAEKDLGCTSDDAPLCPIVWGEYTNDSCKACQDDRDGLANDLGCPSATPLCGVETDNVAVKTYKYGEKCYECYKDHEHDETFTNDTTDYGCNSTNRLCEPDDGVKYGGCRKCLNNVDDATQTSQQQAGQDVSADLGCPDNKPFCVSSTGDGTQNIKIDLGTYGNACAAEDPIPCDAYFYQGNNGLTETTLDALERMTGMDNVKNTCHMEAVGQIEHACVCNPCGNTYYQKVKNTQGGVSYRPYVGSETPNIESCPMQNISSSQKACVCAYCVDTATGASRDRGCSEDPAKPICLTPGEKNDGSGTTGDECVQCLTYNDCGLQQYCDTNTHMCTDCPTTTVKACAISAEHSSALGEIEYMKFTPPRGCRYELEFTAASQDAQYYPSLPVGFLADDAVVLYRGGRDIWHRCNVEGGNPTACNTAKNSIFCDVTVGFNGDGGETRLVLNDNGPKRDGCYGSITLTKVDRRSDGADITEQESDWCAKCREGQCKKDGQWINLTAYDDITVGDNCECVCLGSVRTQTLGADASASGHSLNYSAIRKDRDTDYNCRRLQTYRQFQYTIPVNFMCPRYMHVSDGMQADDFVRSSYPAGIGVTSPAVVNRTWEQSHNNTITPKVSSATITSGTAKLVVQDRWAGEVGLSSGGYFYFTLTQADKTAGVQKLTASGSWAPGSSQNSPVGGYVCKKGAGSSRLPSKYKKHCDRYCSNYTGPY